MKTDISIYFERRDRPGLRRHRVVGDAAYAHRACAALAELYGDQCSRFGLEISLDLSNNPIQPFGPGDTYHRENP